MNTALPTVIMAEASTGNITAEDNELLKKLTTDENAGIIVYDAEFGFIIHVYDWHREEERSKAALHAGLSPAFINLCRLASSQGAKWLNLDCDADVIEWLPHYIW